jgi:aarF domain-containing kinase
VLSSWRDEIVIDPNPIGAGCVAQVYKGKLRSKFNKDSLKYDTVDIAVKMIHPHIESMVHTDMELLSMFAHWLDTFPSLKVLNMGETLTEFGDMMKRQLDLRYVVIYCVLTASIDIITIIIDSSETKQET